MNLQPECSSWYSSTYTDDEFIAKWAKKFKKLDNCFLLCNKSPINHIMQAYIIPVYEKSF